jgi:hypothetical protein
MSRIGIWRSTWAVCALAIILSDPARAIDQEQATREPSTGEVLADAVIARPLGVVGTVLGAVAFVVSLPFTIPSKTVDRAGNALVKKPFQETFKRPIGQLDSCETLPETCK